MSIISSQDKKTRGIKKNENKGTGNIIRGHPYLAKCSVKKKKTKLVSVTGHESRGWKDHLRKHELLLGLLRSSFSIHVAEGVALSLLWTHVYVTHKSIYIYSIELTLLSISTSDG